MIPARGFLLNASDGELKMPEQLSNPKHERTRAAFVIVASAARFARRFTRAASLSVVAVAAACVASTFAFAQDAATKPQPASAPSQKAARPKDAQAKPDGAKLKASEAREKKAAASTAKPASEITAVAPAAAPVAAPSAAPAVAPSAAPSAAPVVSTSAAPAAAAAPAVAPPVDKRDAVETKNSTTKAVAESVEAELERLRAEIKDAKPSAERARLQRALVDKLVALKREEEALDALRLMIHEDRYDPPFFFNTGNALARLGDASAAEDAYRKAIQQRRGNYARALNNLGVILTRQGNWDEARATLASALVQENYTYAEASYNLGRLYLLRGEADLAIREWLRTLRLEPAHAEAAVALARTYAEDGNAKRGLLVLDNFTARATRNGASVPREIADARRELFESTGAKADDENDAANAGTGALDGVSRVARMNNSRSASSNVNASAREVDRATYELLQTARARRESGDLEESVRHYRGVLARSPAGYFPPANLELGAALINLKRDEEAVAALTPVTERDAARYPVAYYHLGRLYERQGHLARAAENFARAATLYGDSNPQVLIDLSRTREKTGDTAGALDAANAYAAAMKRQGTVPAWVAERQAKLKQKMIATGATQGSTAKP